MVVDVRIGPCQMPRVIRAHSGRIRAIHRHNEMPGEIVLGGLKKRSVPDKGLESAWNIIPVYTNRLNTLRTQNAAKRHLRTDAVAIRTDMPEHCDLVPLEPSQ